MKNRKSFILSILLLIFLGTSFNLMAQGGQKKLAQEFEWKETNKKETIKINVEKGAEKLTMDLKGWISEGSFNLTVYDPEGNKTGWFSLVSSGEGGSHVRVETNNDSNSNSNTNTNTNTNGSGSNVTVTTTTTTTNSSDGDYVVKRKSKNKSKSKKKDKKGNYSYSMTDSDDKKSKGVMRKSISDPSPGIWKLVFEVEDATGELTAIVDQE